MRAFASVGVASSLDYRLIDDGTECNFLDKAVVGGRRFGD
jgi:hypothetical protein